MMVTYHIVRADGSIRAQMSVATMEDLAGNVDSAAGEIVTPANDGETGETHYYNFATNAVEQRVEVPAYLRYHDEFVCDGVEPSGLLVPVDAVVTVNGVATPSVPSDSETFPDLRQVVITATQPGLFIFDCVGKYRFDLYFGRPVTLVADTLAAWQAKYKTSLEGRAAEAKAELLTLLDATLLTPQKREEVKAYDAVIAGGGTPVDTDYPYANADAIVRGVPLSTVMGEIRAEVAIWAPHDAMIEARLNQYKGVIDAATSWVEVFFDGHEHGDSAIWAVLDDLYE